MSLRALPDTGRLPNGAVPVPLADLLALDEFLYSLEPSHPYDDEARTITAEPEDRRMATEVRAWLGHLLGDAS